MRLSISDISIINLLIFNFILFLWRPMWFDINKFVKDIFGFDLNYVLIIILTTFVIAIAIFFSKQYKLNSKVLNTIVIIIMLIYNTLLIFLISQLTNELILLKYEFRRLLPLLVTIFILTILIYYLPEKKIWSDKTYRLLPLLVLIVFLLIIVFNKKPFKVIIDPYLNQPSENSISVTWKINKDNLSWVEYGESENLGSTAYDLDNGIKVSDSKIVTVSLVDLKPNTEYYYRTVSKEIKNQYAYYVDYGSEIYSEVKKFKTLGESEESVNFVVFSDIHANVKLLEKLLNNVEDTYDFIVLNGDFVNDCAYIEQLEDELIKPLSKILDGKIPIVFVRGNHEIRGKEARKLSNYISLVNNKYYYKFQHGLAEFSVIDTGEDKFDGHIEYSGLNDFEDYRNEQLEFIKSLDSDKIKINFSHIPINEYLIEERLDPVLDYQKDYIEAFNNYKLDLMLSGHYHFRKSYIKNSEVNFNLNLNGGEASVDEDYALALVSVSKDGIKVKNVFLDTSLNYEEVYSVER